MFRPIKNENGRLQRRVPRSITKGLLCLLTLAASTLLAQNPGPPLLVRLYSTVFDASGQPVADFSAKDFSIADNGNPQTIVFFRKPEAAPDAPSSSEFANRKNGRIGNTVAILFDLINQSQEDRLETWHRLTKSLPQMESGDSVYFYLLNLEGELVPIHAIGPKSADDATWPHDVAPVLDGAMKTASHGKHAQMGPEDQVKKTFHQVEVLANLLAGLPGRKNVMWITDQVPNVRSPKVPCTGDWVDCGLYVPHLAVSLAQANVAVNLVSYDSGLSTAAHADPGSWEDKWTPPPFADTHGAEMQDIGKNLSLSAQGGGSAAKGLGVAAGSRGRDAAMNLAQMALLTGGGIYFHQDVRAAIQSVIVRDANAFEMAYDPSAGNWDNKFHRVRITSNRKGAVVQSQTRYYALPASRPAAERMRAVLLTALQSPTDNSDIGLHVGRLPAPGGQRGVHLDIRVHLADLLMREEDGKFKGSVYLLISDRGAAGPLGEPVVLSLNPVLTKEQYEKAMKEGLPFAQDHPITGAVREVRVIVLDQHTNFAGSITIPVV